MIRKRKSDKNKARFSACQPVSYEIVDQPLDKNDGATSEAACIPLRALIDCGQKEFRAERTLRDYICSV